jgi:tetratricopeptide (TPR) repeat protein
VGRRLTRKQIKQDQFVSFVDRGMHWLNRNWRQAAVGLGVVLVGALLWWGVTAFLGSRSAAASAALVKALEIYQAPVGSAAPAGAPVKFATDAERLDAAQKAFEGVKSHYWLTPQRRMAELFLARVAVDRGDQAKALEILADLTAHRSDDPVVRLAMLDLIRLRVARGEGMQLVPQLQAMAAGKDPRLPRDAAIFQLAQIWDREGKRDEAGKLYKQLVEDFPDSPYRLEAQEHLSAGG